VEDPQLSEGTRLPRTVRGKRPEFYETPGVDEAMSMILVLAQEFAVLRERLDSAEIVAARHGIPLAREIESLVLDEATLRSREAWRQGFYERLFYLAAQRRAELEQQQTGAGFAKVIDDVAKGEI
jgi:hypothetical protein